MRPAPEHETPRPPVEPQVTPSARGWAPPARTWTLGVAAAVLAFVALAQQQVTLQQGAPPPAATVRYGQTTLLPSEQRNVAVRSGLLPSELRDTYRRSGALPSQGLTANAGTVRYSSFNREYNRAVNNQASTSVRYASTVPTASAPRPVPRVATPRPRVSTPTPAVPRNMNMGPVPSTYRPAVPAYSGAIRYGR